MGGALGVGVAVCGVMCEAVNNGQAVMDRLSLACSTYPYMLL